MRVIDLTADPKATPADLERVIGMDQALAAKLLTLANSSYYGLPRRISSLREAVVFLGFKTLRNMAMTITTFNLFLRPVGRGITGAPCGLAAFGRHCPVRQSRSRACCRRLCRKKSARTKRIPALCCTTSAKWHWTPVGTPYLRPDRHGGEQRMSAIRSSKPRPCRSATARSARRWPPAGTCRRCCAKRLRSTTRRGRRS